MTKKQQTGVCLYFQVHQPYRLTDLRVTDIGNEDLDYFDHVKNRAVFRKVAEKCYLPANKVILKLLKQHPEFRVSYSLSGVFLDQCKEYGPDVLASFRKLAKTGRVEFLAETYYHSLSSLRSLPEFCAQVKRHVGEIHRLFGQKPKVFRNTELIYRNEISHIVRLMGFQGIVAEGVDGILGDRSPTVPYVPPHFRLPTWMERIINKERPYKQAARDIHILLKHYRLSDDIAFRFSANHHSGNPLLAETFADWVKETGGHSINLFMDYETFGEHQWADTGIFDFLAALPRMLEERGIVVRTPSQVISQWKTDREHVYDAHNYTSWADSERDLSAWLGNNIQNAALEAIYALEKPVKLSNDPDLVEHWRKLQTSDHFYYMSTKYWADGDVHKYFSPYDSPYEAFRRFSHALQDLRMRLGISETSVHLPR